MVLGISSKNEYNFKWGTTKEHEFDSTGVVTLY